MSKKFKPRLSVFIFWACLSLAQTGPIQRYVRVMREVYPEIEPEKVEGNQPQVCVVGDMVYEAEQPVTADQPCLKCKCQPPGVHCETTRCLKKPGCRAIHKPNKCCPDYQCECEYEGRTYANGERLESKPGGECQVCYCRGGEVQCTEVSCYIRTDCEGKTVPGQCCPKYEHCPAIEPTFGKNSPKPEVEERDATTKTFLDPAINASAENEIGETTLSFDKEENLVSVEATIPPSIENPNNSKDQSTQTDDLNTANDPKITIHEIIPEVKEIPITEPPKQDNTSIVQGQLLVEEKVPSNEEIENHANDVEDSDIESSELSEIFQQPPPVLRIGDHLLFLKKGELVPEKDASTPSPVFTIIGAEGLQRGDIESMEHHELPKEYDNTSSTETPISPVPSEIQKEQKDETVFLDTPMPNVPKETSTVLSKITNDDISTELNQKEYASNTSENVLKIDNATIDVAVELATGNSDVTSEENQSSEDKATESTAAILETTSTTTKKSTDEDKIKVEEIVQLENPAYPPIPDIMSQQGTEYVDHSEIALENSSKDVESSTAEARILPDVLPFRRNNTQSVNATNSSWLKQQETEQLVNSEAVLPDTILKQVASSDLETTTDAISENEHTSENVEIFREEKRSYVLETELPIDVFKDVDLLGYGTVVEKDPTLENQVKKLADEDDVLGTLVSFTQDKTRSTETMENSSAEVSGENTTPKINSGQHASIISSQEDASVEGYHQDTKEISSEEIGGSKNRSYVEIIDPVLMAVNATRVNLTHEENSKETHKDRVEKRTISQPYDPESEKIFQELDSELHLLDHDPIATKSTEDEKKEAEIIFKELLDEINSSTTKKPKQFANSGDSDVLQRVSDAIAKFQIKEARQSLDAGILGILRDFFTSQYRSYKDI